MNLSVFVSLLLTVTHCTMRKVKSMQRSVTEAIRTEIQPSKPKREITIVTNSQNTKENTETIFDVRKLLTESELFFRNITDGRNQLTEKHIFAIMGLT